MLEEVDEPYSNKNIATPKATKLNYQPRFHTNLRGVDTICASIIFLFLGYLFLMQVKERNETSLNEKISR